MKTSGNTVLVTGGSAGIGFAIAKQFSENGNKVIITGRNRQKLEQAAASLQNTVAIVSDITKDADVDALVELISKEHPALNIIVNNAGFAAAYKLSAEAGAYEKASAEMLTNYLAIVRITEKLLPVLGSNNNAAIVNVTSIVAFSPNHFVSTYAASKAALHSYTQSLRVTLAQTGNIKVFELMPPLVNTDFSQSIGGEKGIPASQVADELFEGLNSDVYEIHVGETADLYKLFLSSPAEALKAMNN